MSEEARELLLFVENDGDLYRQQAQPIMRNLARKMVKGTYNATLAVKAWRYLADAGAQKYTKEFDSPGRNGSYGAFSPADRQEVAKSLAATFDQQARDGEIDVAKLAKERN